MSVKWSEFVDALFKLPQTQKDIAKISGATDFAQSPEAKKVLEDAQAAIQSYATTTLILQVVSTVAIVGLLWVAFAGHRNGVKKSQRGSYRA